MADSYHASVHTMLEQARADGKDTAFERMEQQGHRCTYCEQGIRCSLCSQGPCRITAKAARGVCGIGADGKEPVKIDVLVLAMACGSGPRAHGPEGDHRRHGLSKSRSKAGPRGAEAGGRHVPLVPCAGAADRRQTRRSPRPLVRCVRKLSEDNAIRGHIRSSAESTFAHDRRIPSTAVAGGSTTTAAP